MSQIFFSQNGDVVIPKHLSSFPMTWALHANNYRFHVLISSNNFFFSWKWNFHQLFLRRVICILLATPLSSQNAVLSHIKPHILLRYCYGAYFTSLYGSHSYFCCFVEEWERRASGNHIVPLTWLSVPGQDNMSIVQNGGPSNMFCNRSEVKSANLFRQKCYFSQDI